MKKIFKISSLALIAITALVTSCKKEESLHADLSALNRDKIVNTALDDWLDANYLVPYNIQVKYRWDAYEDDLSKDLVPPKESYVQPTMEAVRDIWIRPYEAIGGADFMKINTPKQFYLVGSPSYNDDGTITLGTAEGGKKITLFVINNFSKNNAANTQEMMHVIHHEFTHILNQKLAYDPAFKLVTPNGYTGNWNLVTTPTARTNGFITNYAQASPLEDFAEMTSIMLTQGKYKYDAIVNALAANPKALLRSKEQYVVTYFKVAWNIDFYALQAKVSAALDANAAPLNTMLGVGKYTTFESSPLTASTFTPQSTEFLGLWNAAKTALAPTYVLTKFQILFGNNNLATLRFFFTNSAGTTTYNGDVDYTLSTDANGVTKFNIVNPQPTTTTYSNYTVIKTQVAGIVNYIQNNGFKLDYAPTNPAGTRGLAGAYGAFYKSTDATSYMIGTFN